MSPKLRDIKAREAIKAFLRAGGQERRGKGDHINIKMPNGKIVTLRAVGDVRIGLLKKLLKVAEITEEEFEGYLE